MNYELIWKCADILMEENVLNISWEYVNFGNDGDGVKQQMTTEWLQMTTERHQMTIEWLLNNYEWRLDEPGNRDS